MTIIVETIGFGIGFLYIPYLITELYRPRPIIYGVYNPEDSRISHDTWYINDR
jgi:hypothetical protein